MLEAEQAADEAAVERLEEEEREEEEEEGEEEGEMQQRLATITQAGRQSREHVLSKMRKKQQPIVAHSLQPKSFPTHSTATSLQSLHVPADLALVLQALSSEMNRYKIILTNIVCVLCFGEVCECLQYRETK